MSEDQAAFGNNLFTWYWKDKEHKVKPDDFCLVTLHLFTVGFSL